VYRLEQTELAAAVLGASTAGNTVAGSLIDEATSAHFKFPTDAGHWYTCEPLALREPCLTRAYLDRAATSALYCAITAYGAFAAGATSLRNPGGHDGEKGWPSMMRAPCVVPTAPLWVLVSRQEHGSAE
jgi:hypothetical protein